MHTPKKYLCLIYVVFGIGGLLKAGELKIYWIDVEGGAATLVITSAGESILIDTGNPGARDSVRINALV